MDVGTGEVVFRGRSHGRKDHRWGPGVLAVGSGGGFTEHRGDEDSDVTRVEGLRGQGSWGTGSVGGWSLAESTFGKGTLAEEVASLAGDRLPRGWSHLGTR